MTAKQILELQDASLALDILALKLERSKAKLVSLKLGCDHLFPDGRPAVIPGGFPCSCGKNHGVCEICGLIPQVDHGESKVVEKTHNPSLN